MPQPITLCFYRELNDFLAQDKRGREFSVDFSKARSVKDLIESIGIPHPEIDLIIINRDSSETQSVDFSYQVLAGDHISVYPGLHSKPEDLSIENLPIAAERLHHNQHQPLAEIKFVLDVHLGKLAAYLRLLGFDALYYNDCDDLELAELSASEQRLLLTCDLLLLMRKQVSYGYCVRNRQPKQQLLEILSHFDLTSKTRPFTRCMHCNGITKPVDKQLIESQLLVKTKKYYDEFFQCKSCKKIYWKGSHYQKLKKMIDNLDMIAE